jgi:hypothetical protein
MAGPGKIQTLKKLSFYIAVMGVFTLLIFFILQKGVNLQEGRNIVAADSGRGDWSEFLDSLAHSLEHPLAVLLAQIAR